MPPQKRPREAYSRRASESADIGEDLMRRWTLVGALALAFGVLVGVAAASTPGADVRLTHDANDPAKMMMAVRP